MIQRSASRSYATVASPSLFDWHPPPKPLQSVFVCTGPYTAVPLLLKIANALLTTSTMWLGPTAAFGSGGALLTVKVPCGPVKPAPTPSKLFASEGAALAPGVDWTTGSAAELPAGVGYLC